MSRRLLQRLRTTLLVVLALLYSQLALASYVCPGLADNPVLQAGQPCAGMDAEQPALCHQASAEQDQHFELGQPPALSLPALLFELPLLLQQADEEAQAGPAWARHPARHQRPSPPLFLATLRLRV